MSATLEPIKVDRTWIGAPGGVLTNPTVWLFAISMTILAASATAYLRGMLSVPATVGLNTVAIYLAFTVLHDAMHGTAHRSKLVNAVLGRIAGLPLTIPLPLFRGVHHEHHSHTNDTERDPDLIVARVPRILLPLWCLGVAVEYRLAFFGHRLWRGRADLAEVIATDLAILGVVGAAIAGGWLESLLVLWLVPATLAVLVLAFAFDFLPHHPFDGRARYLDTRIYGGRVLNAVLLGQNYHLVHHLWTTIPWYRYQRVFAEIAPDLAAHGARIGWRRT